MAAVNSIIIDMATEHALPQIMDIERDSFSPPWSFDMLLDEVNNTDSFFRIAKQDSVGILGFVILRRIVDVGELLKIAVKKSAQRQGVADMLVASLFDHARNIDLTSIILEVRKSNDSAISLYLKHGFLPISQRKDYYVDPLEDAVIMIRECNY